MLQFDDKPKVLKQNEAFNQFIDTVEIVGSVEVNKDAAKYLLNQIPSEILEMFQGGLHILSEMTKTILEERKAKQVYDTERNII